MGVLRVERLRSGRGSQEGEIAEVKTELERTNLVEKEREKISSVEKF